MMTIYIFGSLILFTVSLSFVIAAMLLHAVDAPELAPEFKTWSRGLAGFNIAGLLILTALTVYYMVWASHTDEGLVAIARKHAYKALVQRQDQPRVDQYASDNAYTTNPQAFANRPQLNGIPYDNDPYMESENF